MNEQKQHFGRKDLFEIIVGAAILVIPLAITEEAWDLGRDLPLLNILMIAAGSYTVIATFIYFRFYDGDLNGHRRQFAHRVLAVYFVTRCGAALVLLAIGKLPLAADPLIAIKRTVLASLPGSFLATAIDGMN